MAVTYTPTQQGAVHVVGDRKLLNVSLAASGTYVTGGNVISPSLFGLSQLDSLDIVGADPAASAGAVVSVTPAGVYTLRLLTATPSATEFTNANSTNGVTVQVQAWGY